MKGGFIAAAVAALAGAANADSHNHRHHHDLFKKNPSVGSMCSEVCKTIVTVITGEPTLVQWSVTAIPTSTPVSTTSVWTPAVVPTPEVHTCPTPGVYTFTASTITLSETTTVCAATSTPLPSGTHTVGGVTTVVKSATTVTCPYATVQTSNGVVTSTLTSTEYVCPSAGTYTVAPSTITVTDTTTTVTYATATSYCPGTYTKPEQVVTVTETDYTTYCPFADMTPTTTAAAVTSTSKPPPPPPKPTSSAPAAAPSAPASGSKASSQSSSKGASVSGSGDHFGLTYTPYQSSNGDCKTAAEVLADLTLIKSQGFKAIRTYSASDCSTLQNVGNAAEMLGLEMIVGIYISDTGCTSSSPDIAEQIEALRSWAKWDLVKIFTIGNEAIADGYCTASELASLISDVKSQCSFSGPFTTSETVNIWQESAVASALCSVVDIVGSNIHAFFNSETTPATAGTFVQTELSILDDICEGLSAINLECGWPTAGECNGSACPGASEQAEALANIRAAVGDRTFFFSFENDYWKAAGAFDCEQSWGTQDYFAELLKTLGL